VDGGDAQTGHVLRKIANGLVETKWDGSGERKVHRIGFDGRYELARVDATPPAILSV
jgi:DNA-binding PadR family transcriptional regulator